MAKSVLEKINIISGGFHLTLSVYDVLSCGAMPILCGHLQSAYVDGIHELIYGGDGAVDTYVSYYALLMFLFTKGVQR
jgi:hypothetical protein